MSFYKKLKEGDLLKAELDGKFYVYKVLRVDNDTETYHVFMWGPTGDFDKTKLDFKSLRVAVMHSPIAFSGFDEGGVELIGNDPVKREELEGFYSYLKQTDFKRYADETKQDIKKLIERANIEYREACRLQDLNQRIEAMKHYEKAIDLFPLFYEAIDNRALIKMDLARYEDAIFDFDQSLKIEPNGIIATFSMGECFMKIGEYDKALIIFNNCLAIDPNHQPSKDFIEKTKKLKNAQR